jgi:putative MATE family efflux protein
MDGGWWMAVQAANSLPSKSAAQQTAISQLTCKIVDDFLKFTIIFAPMNTEPNKYQLAITNKQIIKIALPISAAILVPQINFVTNNIFLGQLGEKTLAVAGITGVFYLIFAVVGYGLNNGLQSLISRRAGENRIDEIGKLFGHGVRISLGFAAIGIISVYTFVPSVLRFALHDKATQEMAISFLKVRIWGLPFLYIYQMRNALLVGTNNSKFLVIGTLAETIVNIFLDFSLIKGRLGFPALGFNGAAIASIIAEATGLLVVFGVIYFNGLANKLELYRNWKADKNTYELILVQSLPLIAQHTISIVSWEFFYILIEHHGTLDLAVSNAMRNIFGLFGCGLWALAATTNTMVSNVIGQGLENKVMELIKKIMLIGLAFAAIVCTFLNLFPAVFLSIYGQGASFIAAAIPVLRVVSSALVFMAISTVWLNAVTGTGNTKFNLLIEFVAIVFYCTYTWYVLEYKNWPITIGWMSEWIYWMVIFVGSFWYLKSGKWKGKVI